MKLLKELSDFEGQMKVEQSKGETEVINTRVLVKDLNIINEIQHYTGLFRQTLVAKAVHEFAQKHKGIIKECRKSYYENFMGNKVAKKRKGG